MSELQATLEFSVELHKFYNVDLFQRGFYQIRSNFKSSPKVPAKVEVSLPRTKKSDLIFPPSIINGIAVSKTFQILYRNVRNKPLHCTARYSIYVSYLHGRGKGLLHLCNKYV